jgi:hypothetical protein
VRHLSDTAGLPLVIGLSAGNTHDSHGLKPIVAGLQSRHGPANGRRYKPRTPHAVRVSLTRARSHFIARATTEPVAETVAGDLTSGRRRLVRENNSA